jgi:O-antigen/teichoic acid export membrane protein
MLLSFSVVAALVDPTVWGLVAATCLAPVTPLLHRTIAVRRYMRWRPQRRELRAGVQTLPGMLRWAVKMAPGPILTGVAGQSVVWMLGALSTVSAVGAFSRAQMVSARFQQLTIRIVQMLFPTLVARRSAGDHGGFDRALVDTMRYSLVLTLLLPAVAGGAAPAVMAIFGPGFAQASDALGILLFNVSLGSLSIILAYALYAVDRPGLTSWIGALRLVVTVGVSYPAILAFGLEGAALGLVCGVLADVACKQWALRGHLSSPLHTWWPTRQIVGLIVAGAVGYGVSRALVNVIPYPGGLPAILLGGTAAYGLAYLGLVGLTERDRARIRWLRDRVRQRRAQSRRPSGVRLPAPRG